MSMQPGPYTAHRVEQLILAQRRHDHDSSNGTTAILLELLEDTHDAYALALLLAHQAARMAHVMHHLTETDVRPNLRAEDTPADRTAIQLVAAVANDDVQMAKDLAQATVEGNHEHANRTIVSLLYLAATEPRLRAQYTDKASGHVIDPAMN